MVSLNFLKTSLPMNNALYEYCKKSTEVSIQKLTRKFDLERKPKEVISLNHDKPNNINPNTFFFGAFAFFSLTIMTSFFYRRRLT